MQTFVFWGPSGVGKTHRVFAREPDVYRVKRPKKGQPLWFEGYDGEKAILLDDFEGWIPWDELLNITDKWRMQINIKGAHGNASWERVYLTSNSHPETWYPKREYKEPLLRRLTEIVYCDSFEESKKE